MWILDNVDTIEIRPSAFKHGITSEDMRFAVRNSLDQVFLEEDPDKILFVGYDKNARSLEVIVVEFSNGEFYINHAMKVRNSTLQSIERWKNDSRE
jgi:hypothetical protein